MPDLFGRSEQELVDAIAKGEQIYKIASGFPGGRYIQELDRQQRNLDVDRRQLAIMRSEIRDDFPPLFGEALDRFRRTILRTR